MITDPEIARMMGDPPVGGLTTTGGRVVLVYGKDAMRRPPSGLNRKGNDCLPKIQAKSRDVERPKKRRMVNLDD
jgi:hypothetical protein